MEEFLQAYYKVMEGKLHYLIVVLLEQPNDNWPDLPPELKSYLRTHTYIDAQHHHKSLETIREQIRLAMPKVPLRHKKVNLLKLWYYVTIPIG